MRRLLAMVLLGATACGSAYETVELYVIAGEPQAFASAEAIALREGTMLAVDARPVAADGHRPYDGLDDLELRSADPSIVEVRPGILRGVWIFGGVTPGVTSIEVLVDGKLEDRIPLKVAAQP